MQIVAKGWTKQPMGTNANYTFNPATPLRNDSSESVGHGVGPPKM